jgi:hypothetical protein
LFFQKKNRKGHKRPFEFYDVRYNHITWFKELQEQNSTLCQRFFITTVTEKENGRTLVEARKRPFAGSGATLWSQGLAESPRSVLTKQATPVPFFPLLGTSLTWKPKLNPRPLQQLLLRSNP